MGGRGASSNKFDGSKPFAIKYHNGQINHIRKVNENDREYRFGGHMWKEYGSSEWNWSREPISNVIKNNKPYSLKSKEVNPKNYIDRTQRWKNFESKARLEKIRNSRKSGSVVNYGVSRVGFQYRNVSYVDGKKVVNESYKKQSIRNAYESKKSDLKRIVGDIAFANGFAGGATRKEIKKMNKLQRAVNRLGRML